MNKGLMLILATGSVCATSIAQQTPPIQPKTVELPKLSDLQLAGPPKPGDVVVNAPLSVDEAVRIGLAHQPQISISKAAADAAHGQTVLSKSAMGPSVALTSSATRTQALTSSSGGSGFTPGPQTGYQSEIEISQLVWDFNRTRYQTRQSAATESAAYRTYDQTMLDVALTVKQDYFSLIQANQQVDVDTANVKSRQAQVDLTQATVTAGTGEPTDLVSAKTLLDQGVLQLAQAKQAAITARVALALEMGIDPRTPIVLEETKLPEYTVPDSNALVDEALKQRPDIRAAELTLAAAGYGVEVARRTDVPTLNFSAGVNTFSTSSPLDSPAQFVELSFSWTLFDSGNQGGKVETAKAQKSSAAALLVQTTQNAVSQVGNAYVSVKSAEQQITIAAAEVANGAEGVRLAEGRYKSGVTTFLEVITAQANYVSAETDQVNANAALFTALATLDHAVGRKAVM